jgi:hypothetical protein
VSLECDRTIKKMQSYKLTYGLDSGCEESNTEKRNVKFYRENTIHTSGLEESLQILINISIAFQAEGA